MTPVDFEVIESKVMVITHSILKLWMVIILKLPQRHPMSATNQLSFQSMHISFNCPYNPVWQTSLVYLKFAIGTFCWSVNHCVIVLELDHFFTGSAISFSRLMHTGWCNLQPSALYHQFPRLPLFHCYQKRSQRLARKGQLARPYLHQWRALFVQRL